MKVFASPFFAIILSLILFSSCCTKKDCDNEDYLELRVELINLGENLEIDLITIDDKTNLVLDSNRYHHKVLYIKHSSFLDIRDKTFLIKTNKSTIDTVSKINFDLCEVIRECNVCFLKDDDVKVTTYSNLQLLVNGVMHKDSEEIKLLH